MFCQQQKANNLEAAKANDAFAVRMGTIRISYQKLVDYNVTLDSEVSYLVNELSFRHDMLRNFNDQFFVLIS